MRSTATSVVGILEEVDAQRAAAVQHENALLHTIVKALCGRIDALEARVDSDMTQISDRLDATEHVTHSVEEIERTLQSELACVGG